MTYTRTTWVDNTTLVDAAKMNNIETELVALDPLTTTVATHTAQLATLGSIPAPTYSATPPASPVDGQQWFYPAPNGGVWHLRYNAGSGSAYKWDFCGGNPITTYYSTLQNMVTLNTWVGNLQPALSIPRAGEYQIDLKLDFAGVGATIYLGVDKASAPNGSIFSAVSGGQVGNSTSGFTTYMPGLLSGWAALAAGEGIRTCLNATAACAFLNTYLRATPVRIS